MSVRDILAEVVVWCWHHARAVILAAVVVTLGLGWYAANHLSIDTDESKMLSPHLPFRQAEDVFDRAFPALNDLLVVVIDAPTPEASEAAVEALNHALAPRHDLFHSVRRAPEEVFFRSHGLLFLDPSDLSALSDRLSAAQPLLGSIAADPTLRGLLKAVDLTLEGVARGQAKAEDIKPLTSRLDAAAAALAAGEKPVLVSWQDVLEDDSHHDTPRRVLLTQPILQYDGLEAGGAASAAIHAAADTLGLTPANGYRVRLTGDVALSDANFATIASGMGLSGGVSLLLVGGLLWLAVRSGRVVGGIAISLLVGLVATAAFAAAMVGTLNPISVAFAVMFIGIAVDFAIQFAVCLADCQAGDASPEAAIRATARRMGGPLPVAAVATAMGFLSFLPTDYIGVSQLGLIAGAGMLIALVVDFTVLPALLAILKPPARPEKMALPLAALDGFLHRHSRRVTMVGLLLAVTGAGLLPSIALDFNPIHLQDPKTEAVSTFIDLAADPDAGVYAIEALAPNKDTATALAARFDHNPLFGHTLTLATFVPDKQDDKRAILDDLATLLGPTLNPASVRPPPSDDDLAAALASTIAKLTVLLPDALLTSHLKAVQAKGAPALRAMDTAVAGALPGLMDTLRAALVLSPVSEATLPADLRANWIAPDGRWRVEASPALPPTTQAQLLALADAGQAAAPNASGTAIAVVESGRAVVHAFGQAGVGALLAIVLLLGLLLRRMLDAVLVLLPLVVGSLLTVIGLRVLGLSINFANIIALPLLLGIGVAFNIYFVVNWRSGVTAALTTATARAVLFSALTTGSAFGSLALSPHLGTASMGLLLFLSLGLTVATTFLWLPALLYWIPQRLRGESNDG